MKKRKKPLPGRKTDAEFGYDLTPDIRDGDAIFQHADRLWPDSGRLHRNRGDDQPHLGRKGGEF